ncbi:MAG: bis(5'-nucleosyl)-tetraphosphatase (symmetrical) YqeK [bacterium]
MGYIKDRDSYISFLKRYLSPERFVHSLEVERESIALAKRYGVSLEKASIAGLLHDCAKGFSNEELINLAKRYNLPLSSYDLLSPQILHAPVGAIFAREYFGINDGEIIRAISVHTTGDKDMNLLDKIVFIADYVEYYRNFPGVTHIRELLKKDIDSAIIFAFNLTVGYVMRNNGVIHPKTIEAWNSILISKGGEKIFNEVYS